MGSLATRVASFKASSLSKGSRGIWVELNASLISPTKAGCRAIQDGGCRIRLAAMRELQTDKNAIAKLLGVARETHDAAPRRSI
eukprot:8260095-Pyramimonas_sp.AAC.1